MSHTAIINGITVRFVRSPKSRFDAPWCIHHDIAQLLTRDEAELDEYLILARHAAPQYCHPVKTANGTRILTAVSFDIALAITTQANCFDEYFEAEKQAYLKALRYQRDGFQLLQCISHDLNFVHELGLSPNVETLLFML